MLPLTSKTIQLNLSNLFSIKLSKQNKIIVIAWNIKRRSVIIVVAYVIYQEIVWYRISQIINWNVRFMYLCNDNIVVTHDNQSEIIMLELGYI